MPPTEYFARAEDLTEIADAIREKGDTSASLSFPDGFISAINDIDTSTVVDRIEQLIDGNNPISGNWTNTKVTVIGYGAFASCTSLQTVFFPNCTTIGSNAFNDCDALQTVSFPNCTTIGSCAFYYCDALQTVSFPNCTTIESGAFYMCRSLQSVSFPNCTTIGSDSFKYSNLQFIYLLTSSVVTLASVKAFANTPISDSTYLGYFGSIFVPTSLVNEYKTATNWSQYSAQLVGV